MLFDSPVIVKLPANMLLAMQEVVVDCFPKKCMQEGNHEFRERCANAQGEINARVTSQDVLGALNVFGPDMRVQSAMYLRAQRPQFEGQAVGWHRESMYGCPPEAFNVWIPIMNCTTETSIRYVPGSAGIPDDDIEIAQEQSPDVTRGSAGHRIGLLYAPKRIVGGVDLTSAIPMNVPQGSCAVFDSQLIHGAAVNNTDRIRFSCDFRVVAQYALAENKKHFDGTYWR